MLPRGNDFLSSVSCRYGFYLKLIHFGDGKKGSSDKSYIGVPLTQFRENQCAATAFLAPRGTLMSWMISCTCCGGAGVALDTI